MVVDNLNVHGIAINPLETDSPLIIDANAILSRPVAPKLLQMIGRRHAKVVQPDGIIDHPQLAQRSLLDVGRQFPRALTRVYLFGFGVFEGLYHALII